MSDLTKNLEGLKMLSMISGYMFSYSLRGVGLNEILSNRNLLESSLNKF